MDKQAEKKESSVVGYNGKCPICGSADGMIQKGTDGRFRNICRVMGCPAFYRPAPYDGYEAKDEAANPFESSLFAVDGMTVKQYLHGRGD